METHKLKFVMLPHSDVIGLRAFIQVPGKDAYVLDPRIAQLEAEGYKVKGFSLNPPQDE